jgi:ribosomal-protein-alanine N-acetyltransferase
MRGRLNLELLSKSHTKELFHYFSDCTLYEFIPLKPPRDEEQFGAWINRILKGPTDHNEVWLNWVSRKKTDLRPVGFIQTTICQDARAAYLAYFTFRPFWGQGFAKEACQMVLHLLRKRDDVAVVTAKVDAENRSSLALLQSLGFQRKRLSD